jgi:hypothetical protein
MVHDSLEAKRNLLKKLREYRNGSFKPAQQVIEAAMRFFYAESNHLMIRQAPFRPRCLSMLRQRLFCCPIHRVQRIGQLLIGADYPCQKSGFYRYRSGGKR